jgi:hypothetical protein
MLEAETKKMEEKLELVRKMMDLEKDKRSEMAKSKEGSIWRGATTKKNIKGYSDAVINHHKKNQKDLPPTSLVTDTSKMISSRQPQQTTQTRSFTGLRSGGASRGSIRSDAKPNT